MAGPATPPNSFVDLTLQELFPKQEYGKDKAAAFHFIVIHAKDVGAALRKWEATVAQKYDAQGFYNTARSKMELSPLQVAVMKGDAIAAAFFLDHGAQWEVKDRRGWTPFHHAAARGDYVLLELLKGKGRSSSMEEKNGWGSTPQEFLQMQRSPQADEDGVVCLYEESPCSARQFKKLTGAEFTDRVVATTEGLYSEWLRDQLPFAPLTVQMQEQYIVPHLKDRRPLLELRRAIGVGLEVVAGEDLPARRILGEYTGRLVRHRLMGIEGRVGDYLMEGVDGEEMRNLIPMINDGPPNCFACAILNHEGLPRRVMFIALRALKKGEPLTYDYEANHPIKWGFYHLTGAQTDDLVERWRFWLTHNTDGDPLYSQQYTCDSFYVTNTPEALLQLTLKDPSLTEPIEELFEGGGGGKFGLEPFYIHSATQLLKSARKFATSLTPFPAPLKEAGMALAIKLIHLYERFFASEILDMLTLAISTQGEKVIRSDLEELFIEMADRVISEQCRRILAERRKLAASGVKLGSMPIDAEAVLQRLNPSS